MMKLKDPQLLREQAYVNGEWVGADSGASFEVRNPATGAVLARVPDIAHVTARAGTDEIGLDPMGLNQTDTFLVEQLGYFLDQLKEHKEEDTSLLDTTQVLWSDWPMVSVTRCVAVQVPFVP